MLQKLVFLLKDENMVPHKVDIIDDYLGTDWIGRIQVYAPHLNAIDNL